MLNRLRLASTSTLEARMTAREVFLKRDTPITEILRPLADGSADWESTRDALLDVTWADDPKGTAADHAGKDGSTWNLDNEPGNAPPPGTWREIASAHALGILTREQYRELSVAVDAKADAGGYAPAPQ